MILIIFTIYLTTQTAKKYFTAMCYLVSAMVTCVRWRRVQSAANILTHYMFEKCLCVWKQVAQKVRLWKIVRSISRLAIYQGKCLEVDRPPAGWSTTNKYWGSRLPRQLKSTSAVSEVYVCKPYKHVARMPSWFKLADMTSKVLLWRSPDVCSNN